MANLRNPEEIRLRNEDIRRMYLAGNTLERIGRKYSITRERVRQILGRFGVSASDGGQAERIRQRDRTRDRKRDARYIARWGHPWADHVVLREMPGHPIDKFRMQERDARRRGIGWDLTLQQWWNIWEESGRWPERGRGRGFVMCRYGDVGPYAVGNVYIATGVTNMKDYWVNKRAREGQEAPICGAAEI